MSESRESADTPNDPFDALLERAARLSPFPASPLATRLHPGLALCDGRFRLLRRVGAGGMGVVFEAFDRERGTEVAIKTLTRLDASGIYKLKNEFRALADVTHPNLVRLYDLFVDQSLWLFSMELVRGSELDGWLRPNHEVELGRLRASFEQLALGVHAIHTAGRLHRDLKPSNVLVEASSGRVVILDFGLVSDPEHAAPGRTRARDTGISGTPHYMAPEQAAGEPGSTASDMYALGVMLFEALTRRVPFDGELYDILQHKRAQPARRARELAADTPEDLDALCAALLDRDPEARPSALELATTLRGYGAAPLDALRLSPASERALLGRDTELEVLRTAYQGARAGRASLVCVHGESGIGKSALAERFLDDVRKGGHALVLSGRCYERENVPYKAFDRVVDELTRHLRALPEPALETLLPDGIAALAQIFPVLARCPAIGKHDLRPSLDAAEQRRRAFDAFARLLGALREREPLVIYIDDLHWLDQDSTLLFERVLSELAPPPCLFLISRTGPSGGGELLQRVLDAASKNPQIDARELRLGPLDAQATRAIAARLLGEDAAVEAIAREAEGSPFFAGELARSAAERHTQAPPSASISLEGTVRERVARLGEDAETLLAVIAVAGRPTPVDVLVQAAGPSDDPHRALDALRRAHLAREAGQRHYECYHDRIRAAVSGGLGAARLARYHAQLATAWGVYAEADPELLFSHWLAAGQRGRAGRHALQAAEKAATALAFARRAELLAYAIELLPTGEVEALELRARRAEALSLAGHWAEAGHAYRDAGERAGSAPHRELMVFHSAVHLLGSGQADTGLVQLRRMFASAGVRWPLTRAGALLAALVRFGLLYLRAGHGRDRRDEPRTGAHAIDTEMLTRWLAGAGFVPAYDLPRGLYFMSVFAGRALRSGDDVFAGLALAMLAAMFCTENRTKTRAREFARRACELARAHEYYAATSATLSFVAYAHLVDGRPRETLELGIEAERLARTQGRGNAYTAWAARACQAYALLGMGRVGEAAAVFEENARFATEAGDDLALIGGDCALRHLASDDLARAHELLARKEAFLQRTAAGGVLRELIRRERMFCALYEGRGAEAVAHFVESSRLLALFDPGMPLACAALQADPRGSRAQTRRIVERARTRLLAQGDAPSSRAMALQLAAAISLWAGDVPAAIAALDRGARCYLDADMALHAALLRMRAGVLRGEPDAVAIAERFMHEQGIAKPSAWAAMLSSGLSR